MSQPKLYIDLQNQTYALEQLDAEEQTLLQKLQDFAANKPEWSVYQNFYMPVVAEFYTARGLSRREIIETIPWRIAQDLSSRIGLAEGTMRPSDYRSELEMLIRTKFKTRRSFCEATGLGEDMISHVLAGRKNLSLETLTEALKRIGYGVHIAPLPNVGPDASATTH